MKDSGVNMSLDLQASRFRANNTVKRPVFKTNGWIF